MWYFGGSRPDRAQVGRFSSKGTVVPKGFLIKEAILLENALQQEGPYGEQCLIADTATLYK